MRRYQDPYAPVEFGDQLGQYLSSIEFEDERVQIHFFRDAQGHLAVCGTKNGGVPVATVERLARVAVAAFLQAGGQFPAVDTYFDGYRSGSV